MLISGSPIEVAFGSFRGGPRCADAAAGFINGAIVVWGRLQPIITTLATGAVVLRHRALDHSTDTRAAMCDEDLADFMTYTLFGDRTDLAGPVALRRRS